MSIGKTSQTNMKMKNITYEVFYTQEEINKETGEVRLKSRTVSFTTIQRARKFQKEKKKVSKECLLFKVEQINKNVVVTPVRRRKK